MMLRRELLVALLCLAWILPGLVAHDPWKPDEANNFGPVYELLQGGSWVVPALAGEPFLKDPPLYFLSAAAFAKLLSDVLPLHDGARLVTGLWMALTLLFTAAAARELNGERYGALAVLLLLGCFGLVVRSHQLITDVATLAGFAMAYYGFALAPRRAGWGGFWTGTGIGVGFLATGPLTLVILGIVAVLLPACGSGWRSRAYLASLGVTAAAALPWVVIWPLLLWQRSPALFDAWLQISSVGRSFGGGSGSVPATAYYLRILPWYAFPAWLLALWTLWRARTSGLARPAIVLPLAGFIVTLILLSASPDAREIDALPLLLPLALLAVRAPETLRRGAANAWLWFSVMGFTFFIAVMWFYWTALELGVPARLHQHLHTIRPGYEFGFRWFPFLLGLAYTAAWFAVLLRLKRSAERPVIVWTTGITAIWALIAILFVSWADTVKSYRSMIADMGRALPANYRCVSSLELGEPQRALLHYFAGIITYREEIPERRRDCDLLLVQGKPLDELVLPEYWRKIWEGHRPGDKDERYRLYRRTVR
jgi:4-amino-4-deoxy-L-arabinose transferase-like glycosyltransferase